MSEPQPDVLHMFANKGRNPVDPDLAAGIIYAAAPWPGSTRERALGLIKKRLLKQSFPELLAAARGYAGEND